MEHYLAAAEQWAEEQGAVSLEESVNDGGRMDAEKPPVEDEELAGTE